MLLEAFDSNWIAPTGPDIDAFERELAEKTGVAHAVALSSGTAALHLALLLAGVERGTRCWFHPSPSSPAPQPSPTWGASGVRRLLCRELEPGPGPGRGGAEREGRGGAAPSAVITVDRMGRLPTTRHWSRCAAGSACRSFEDSAEALGATHRGQAASSFGVAGIFSFNGNKIITTSGGGMLVTQLGEFRRQARHLASQAREPFSHFQHTTVGHNYRLSNLLAALGRAQLRDSTAASSAGSGSMRRTRKHWPACLESR